MVKSFESFIDEMESDMQSFNESAVEESACLVEETLTQCNVDAYELHYITEATKKTLLDRIKEFIAKIVNSFKSFARDLKTRIDAYTRKKEFTASLNRAKEKLLKQKEEGVKYVEVRDVWKYKSIYKKLNGELWDYVKRFEKMNYKKAWQIEDDLERFDQVLEKYSQRLDAARELKKEVTIDAALNFVTNELRGKSEMYKELNEEIVRFEDLKNRADQFETRFNLVGEGMIEEKTKIIGKIKGVFTRMLSWVKKQLLKVMMFGIFLFA